MKFFGQMQVVGLFSLSAVSVLACRFMHCPHQNKAVLAEETILNYFFNHCFQILDFLTFSFAYSLFHLGKVNSYIRKIVFHAYFAYVLSRETTLLAEETHYVALRNLVLLALAYV